ncbi:helix-turn-helix domain-containing protein [Cetobacterium somerae]|uniref:helix-turn-helix domain-containing protein n=1 Tax=Cetobacterium sp. NK01 TaxID=2993530 RepID=UPI002116BC0A|nr:helix-turn-helix domain-containing protein [Cetobacterium sp. NK01]MCQ8210966.1 helix-turn-helix domain-containing protein [Cetobacterium sp. NK01]
MFLIEKLYLLKGANSTLDVAKFLNRSPRTIRRYKVAGFLESNGPKNRLLFSKKSIEAFIIARGL